MSSTNTFAVSLSIYSDMVKDRRGFRPSSEALQRFATVAEVEAAISALPPLEVEEEEDYFDLSA